jgi:hypothetical protein
MIRLVRVNRVRFNWNQGLLKQRDTFLCIPLLGIAWKLWTRKREEPDDESVKVFTKGSQGIH